MINKYLLIATIFCIPFLFGSSFSKPGPIYEGGSGTPSGFFEEDGSIIRANNLPVGNIDSNGFVYEYSSSIPIATIYKEGSILGRNGIPIGNISSDGFVYEYSSSTPIGWVDQGGNVMRRNGLPVAQVPDPRIGALMLLGVIKLQ